MPKTRCSESENRNEVKIAVSVERKAKVAKVKKATKTVPKETAYERLHRKWQETKMKTVEATTKGQKSNRSHETQVEPAELQDAGGSSDKEANSTQTNTRFLEDDNVVKMDVSDEQRKEFPSPSEDDLTESDSDEEEDSINNNATVRPSSTQGSKSPCAATDLPDRRDRHPSGQDELHLKQTFNLIQSFMLKKGLIDETMDPEQLQKFIEEGDVEPEAIDSGKTKQKQKPQPKKPAGKKNVIIPCETSNSDVTIYKKAVPVMEPDLDSQITQFIANVRYRNEIPSCQNKHKISASSDESAMDTSEESDVVTTMIDNNKLNLISAGGKTNDHNHWITDPKLSTSSQPTGQQLSDDVIKDAERSKAKLFEVPRQNKCH